jgi:hypothetical protein
MFTRVNGLHVCFSPSPQSLKEHICG